MSYLQLSYIILVLKKLVSKEKNPWLNALKVELQDPYFSPKRRAFDGNSAKGFGTVITTFKNLLTTVHNS